MKTVSGKTWRDVDTGEIFDKLKLGVTESEAGVQEAVTEMYLLVRAPLDEHLKKKDCLFPHHELDEDGNMTLSRAALVEVTALFADEKTLKDFSDEEIEEGQNHLRRHYEEAEIELPDSLVETTGEMVALAAAVNNKMAVRDIAVSPSINLEKLKEGDDDPLEIVVEIPTGKSTRGWNYLPESLQDIVEVANKEGLPGYEGHQAKDNVDWEFRQLATHWVGGKFQDGKAYFRGLVDKSAEDLKRWIRAGTVKTVSIWGQPTLRNVRGEVNVTGYNPLSIDWTPPRRAGMPTRIVAMGEMDSTLERSDGSFENLQEVLQEAIREYLKTHVNGDINWMVIKRTFPDQVIIEVDAEDGESLYKLDYAVQDGEITISDLKKVYASVTYYEMDGEIDKQERNEEVMTWKEMAEKLNKMVADKEVTMGQIIETLQLTAEIVAGEMGEVKEAIEGAETLAKVKEVLGVSGEMDVLEVAENAQKSIQAHRRAERDQLVTSLIDEKVKGEMAQKLVAKMLTVEDDATKEDIAGEIDTLLGDEEVKGVLDKLHIDKPAPKGNEENKKDRQFTTTKRMPI